MRFGAQDLLEVGRDLLLVDIALQRVAACRVQTSRGVIGQGKIRLCFLRGDLGLFLSAVADLEILLAGENRLGEHVCQRDLVKRPGVVIVGDGDVLRQGSGDLVCHALGGLDADMHGLGLHGRQKRRAPAAVDGVGEQLLKALLAHEQAVVALHDRGLPAGDGDLAVFDLRAAGIVYEVCDLVHAIDVKAQDNAEVKATHPRADAVGQEVSLAADEIGLLGSGGAIDMRSYALCGKRPFVGAVIAVHIGRGDGVCIGNAILGITVQRDELRLVLICRILTAVDSDACVVEGICQLLFELGSGILASHTPYLDTLHLDAGVDLAKRGAQVDYTACNHGDDHRSYRQADLEMVFDKAQEGGGVAGGARRRGAPGCRKRAGLSGRRHSARHAGVSSSLPACGLARRLARGFSRSLG